MSAAHGRTFYVCLDVRSTLRDLANRPTNDPSEFTGPGGAVLSVRDAATALTIALARGHVLLPLSPQCGKPCKHSGACDGFDFAGKGCPGHPS